MKNSFFISALALSVVAAGACGDLQQWGTEGIAYTPDGKVIAFLESEVRFFDSDAENDLGSMKTGLQRGGWVPVAARYATSSNGGTLAVAAGHTVKVYDAQARHLVANIPVSGYPDDHTPVAGVTLSADGSLIAVSTRSVAPMDNPSRLTVWRVSDASMVTEIARAAGRESLAWGAIAAFSPDGSRLYGVDEGYTGGSNFVAYLAAWNIPDGGVVWETVLPDPSAPSDTPPQLSSMGPVALSSDGAWLATGSFGIKLFRASDGVRQDLPARDPFPVGIGSLHFSPDGQRLVASHYTNAMPDPLVFGLDGSTQLAVPAEFSGCADSVFSTDGTRVIAACNPWLKIWDIASGDLLRKVEVTVPVY
jgi:WD40 repeat protein